MDMNTTPTTSIKTCKSCQEPTPKSKLKAGLCLCCRTFREMGL